MFRNPVRAFSFEPAQSSLAFQPFIFRPCRGGGRGGETGALARYRREKHRREPGAGACYINHGGTLATATTYLPRIYYVLTTFACPLARIYYSIDRYPHNGKRGVVVSLFFWQNELNIEIVANVQAWVGDHFPREKEK